MPVEMNYDSRDSQKKNILHSHEKRDVKELSIRVIERCAKYVLNNNYSKKKI